MPENMDKWASGNRKIAKSGHRVAAEMIPFPRRWHGSMISANLEAIWGMSVKKIFTPGSNFYRIYSELLAEQDIKLLGVFREGFIGVGTSKEPQDVKGVGDKVSVR